MDAGSCDLFVTMYQSLLQNMVYAVVFCLVFSSLTCSCISRQAVSLGGSYSIFRNIITAQNLPVAVWHSDGALVSIRKVSLCRALLILGWAQCVTCPDLLGLAIHLWMGSMRTSIIGKITIGLLAMCHRQSVA